jgi:hypothetical protein
MLLLILEVVAVYDYMVARLLEVCVVLEVCVALVLVLEMCVMLVTTV